MGRRGSLNNESREKGRSSTRFALSSSTTAFDPEIASLFSKSSGPIKAPTRGQKLKELQVENVSSDEQDLSSASETDDGENTSGKSVGEGEAYPKTELESPSVDETRQAADDSTRARKRKRKQTDADLEGLYLQKLAREEEHEQTQRELAHPLKRQKPNVEGRLNVITEAVDGDALSFDGEEEEFIVNDEHEKSTTDIIDVPQHETLQPKRSPADVELDKANRTVFLANVSTTAITSKSARKTLIAHLSSPLSTLTTGITPQNGTSSSIPTTSNPKLLTLRFRSTAYAPTLPKKAAYATAATSLTSATTPSTNAYAVYSTPVAARTAVRALNATVVLSRHLRADLVAHPAPIDHRRCVFVGNLGFVDDETSIKAAEAASGKKGAASSSKPLKGDVEEGLWRAFGQAGTVESVRVVRDEKTRVGKGFGYVQFVDQNGVEKALGMDGEKFPPLLMRKMRVVRAKKVWNTNGARERATGRVEGEKSGTSQGGEKRPQEGRTRKLLGKAGAASASASNRTTRGTRGDGSKIGKPEDFVFEGRRASSKQGGGRLKSARTRTRVAKPRGKASKGKPTTRSARRGTEWKKKMGTGQVSGREEGCKGLN